MQAFNHLAQYASTHVDSDEKKRECFLEGLNSKLKLHLGNRLANFHELVDDALTMEDRLRVAGEEERKKRQFSAPSSGPSQRPHLVHQPPQHFVLRLHNQAGVLSLLSNKELSDLRTQDIGHHNPTHPAVYP